MDTDRFQLSKLSPVKTLDTRGCAGLSDGCTYKGSVGST